MKPNRYIILEKLIGVRFKNRDLLDQAFTHSSYVNEHRGEKISQNERLEFLGDAVLQLITTEFLYETFPDSDEGELTTYRASVVKGDHLAIVAQTLSLGNYLYLSHGEEKGGGRKKSFLLANTMEALLGAMYLDQGFSVCRKFIKKFILQKLGGILAKGLHVDAKTEFQEMSQELLKITPVYRTLSNKGPDHSKIFVVGAFLNDMLIAKGEGQSKQTAEQEAAGNALQVLKRGKVALL